MRRRKHFVDSGLARLVVAGEFFRVCGDGELQEAHRSEELFEVGDFRFRLAVAHAGVEAGFAPVPEWLAPRAWADRYPLLKWREVLGLGDRDSVTELDAKLERVLDPQKRGCKSKSLDQVAVAQFATAGGFAVDIEK